MFSACFGRTGRSDRRPGSTAAAVAATAVALAGVPALGQEVLEVPGVVVSASRVAVPDAAVGSAVTVITAEEIEASQARFVADVLRGVPGVSVSRTGGFGGPTQVRLRGAEGNHTLVLINGIEAGDPFNGGEFDFSQLRATDIERIEVVRGPQSALYGSEAIGGVIAITTKRATPGLSGEVAAEAGSFATRSVSATANAGLEAVDLRLSAEYFDTAGFDISPTGEESDGTEIGTLTFRGAARPADALEFRLDGRLVHRTLETDAQEFVFGTVVDSEDFSENREINLRGEGRLDLMDGAWRHTVGAAYTDSQRDRFSGGTLSSGSEGTRYKVDYQSDVTLTVPDGFAGGHGFTVLAEAEHERFRNVQPFFAAADRQRSTTDYAIVGEYRVDLFDRLFLGGAVRHDRFDAFEDATTYRATGSFAIPETGSRLHASVGTGIQAPTFFELFGFDPGTFVGNPDLRPETSTGWDVGIEQRFLDGRVVADVTYFEADLEDEIRTDFAGGALTPVNLPGESERSGIETSLRLRPADGLTLGLAYTYLDAREPGGEVEVRRPRHTASFDADWRFLDDRANLNLGVDYNGETEDLEFASSTPRTRVTLDDYTLVSLAGSFAPIDGVEVFGRIENALDQDYEEVFGFETPGRAVFIGARLRLGPGGLN